MLNQPYSKHVVIFSDYMVTLLEGVLCWQFIGCLQSAQKDTQTELSYNVTPGFGMFGFSSCRIYQMLQN